MQGAKKDDGYDTDAPTAILIEAKSGSILFEKNADELRAPSSMMKLMTAEVVFNAIIKGEIKLNDEFRISENTWRKGGAPSGGSTMFAAINSRVSVDDLLRGALIQSGNDSCMALAEGLSNTEAAFAERMTKRARELGLTKSTFANSNGLPDPGNKMTVRELSVLARHIILTYPDFYKLFNEREFTWNKIRQQNRNPLLTMMEGADGLKTGYTKEGGYGMVGSAVQNGLRLIVVVNGLEDPEIARPRPRSCWNGVSATSRRARCSPRIRPSVTRGCSAAKAAPSSWQAPNPSRSWCSGNGTDKLVARIIYTGPVRAPVQPRAARWRVESLARQQHRAGISAGGSRTRRTGSTTRRALDGASELVIGLFRAGAEKL